MEIPRDIKDLCQEDVREFLNSFDTVMTDCDGVLWHIHRPIPGALETLKTLQDLGKRVLFVSNNSTSGIDDYITKLKSLGFEATHEQIVIPSIVILWYLKKIKFEGKALVIGTKAFRKVFEDGGIDVITAPTTVPEEIASIKALAQLNPEVKAVIFDFDLNLSWCKLFQASLYLAKDDVIYLTGGLDTHMPFSTDLSLIGIGQFSDMLTERTGKTPIKCAKPSEQLQNYLLQHCKIGDSSRCIFVGDSLSADIKFAKFCGFKSVWVGSGLDTIDSPKSQKIGITADYYLSNLGCLKPLIETSINGKAHREQD